MKQSAPTLSELLWDHMEVRAKAGRKIADRANERGHLTTLETWNLKLLNVEQESTRSRWAESLRDEGRYVDLLDYPNLEPTSGLHITNRRGERPVVWLYGSIGQKFEGGISGDEFMREFSKLGPDVDVVLRVHSDGGLVHEAFAMREVIMSRRGRSDGFVDGLAASAATLVLCACSSVTMGLGARYMIHEVAGKLESGRADDFDAAAQQLRETNETIVKIYSQRWKGTRTELLAALHAETWFSDQEAVAVGLADGVSDKLSLAAKVSPEHQYKNVPSEVQIAAKASDCPTLMACKLALHRCAIVQ